MRVRRERVIKPYYVIEFDDIDELRRFHHELRQSRDLVILTLWLISREMGELDSILGAYIFTHNTYSREFRRVMRGSARRLWILRELTRHLPRPLDEIISEVVDKLCELHHYASWLDEIRRKHVDTLVLHKGHWRFLYEEVAREYRDCLYLDVEIAFEGFMRFLELRAGMTLRQVERAYEDMLKVLRLKRQGYRDLQDVEDERPMWLLLPKPARRAIRQVCFL